MSPVDVTVVSIAAGVVVAVAATVVVADKMFRRSFYQFPHVPFPLPQGRSDKAHKRQTLSDLRFLISFSEVIQSPLS